MMSGRVEPQDASARYDDREPPFLIVTLPPCVMSEHAFRANLREMDRFAERSRGAFGFVIDTRGAPDPDAPRRRAIAEYWDGCRHRYGDSFVGSAIVMSSATGRAVFKAILWLRSSQQLLLPVATPDEGIARLRAASARVSPPKSV